LLGKSVLQCLQCGGYYGCPFCEIPGKRNSILKSMSYTSLKETVERNQHLYTEHANTVAIIDAKSVRIFSLLK
jgi:hypothetical protein